VSKSKILVVDDDPLVCESLKELLLLEGYAVDTAPDGEAAVTKVKADHFHLIISDIQMPGLNGMELLKELKGVEPDAPVIFITGHGHIDGAVEAIKQGAYDYVTKPIDDVRLKLTIQRALEQRHLLKSLKDLKKRLKPWDVQTTITFRDPKMTQLLELAHTIAGTQATVLITGESGTGKTLLAQYIHEHSDRKNQPFIKISCGALSETLLESELFGHVKGAFTGALRDKKGKFEEAHGGTIFLDDINTASPSLQTKLLRVLQEKCLQRVGGNTDIQVDVRIICATNTSLQEEVAQKKFREDLYYRVNVVGLHIPPLRERLGDIAPLAEHFIKRFNLLHRRRIKGLARSALQILLRHPWPGNVRELENVMEQAVILSRGEYVVPESLPLYLRDKALPSLPETENLTLEEALALAERQILQETLERCQWNRQEAAKTLGISRTTLFNKMRRFQLFGRRTRGRSPLSQESRPS
jgi:DNA-binding NtrC family response regulator